MLAIATESGVFKLYRHGIHGRCVQDGTVVAGVSGVWNASEIKKVWGRRLRGSKASDLHLRGTADPDGLLSRAIR